MQRWKLRLLVMLILVCIILPEQAIAACGADPPLPVSGLEWPIEGKLINGWSLVCKTDSGHRGIDIAADKGAIISSAADGMVVFVGYTPAEGGGLTISIDHDGGLRSTYLHLSETAVAAGDHVAKNQAIGNSDGRPLHFGLKLSGQKDSYFNPLLYLPEIRSADYPPIAGEAAENISTPVDTEITAPPVLANGVFPEGVQPTAQATEQSSQPSTVPLQVGSPVTVTAEKQSLRPDPAIETPLPSVVSIHDNDGLKVPIHFPQTSPTILNDLEQRSLARRYLPTPGESIGFQGMEAVEAVASVSILKRRHPGSPLTGRPQTGAAVALMAATLVMMNRNRWVREPDGPEVCTQ